jgi:hypothetical protein
VHGREKPLAVQQHRVVDLVDVPEVVDDVLEQGKGRGVLSAGEMDLGEPFADGDGGLGAEVEVVAVARCPQ